MSVVLIVVALFSLYLPFKEGLREVMLDIIKITLLPARAIRRWSTKRK